MIQKCPPPLRPQLKILNRPTVQRESCSSACDWWRTVLRGTRRHRVTWDVTSSRNYVRRRNRRCGLGNRGGDVRSNYNYRKTVDGIRATSPAVRQRLRESTPGRRLSPNCGSEQTGSRAADVTSRRRRRPFVGEAKRSRFVGRRSLSVRSGYATRSAVRETKARRR